MIIKFKTQLIAIFCLFLFQSLTAQTQRGSFSVNYNDGGVTRTFYMWVPNDYDSTKAYPLLYAWHGNGMPGNSMRDLIMSVNGPIQAIICSPDINSVPNSGLATMVNTSLQYLTRYNIDPQKKVITGFSMGGGLAYQLGLLNPILFTGIIGLSPAIGVDQVNQDMWDNLQRLRMATILGSLDFNYTEVKGLMDEIKIRRGELLYLEKPGVTHSDQVYFSSQEFAADYLQSYNYVIGNTTSVVEDLTPDNLQINAYPNPFTDVLNIQISSETKEKLELNITDLQGKVVYELSNTTLSAGNNFQKSIPVSGLAKGVYILKATSGSRQFIQKLVKVN